MDIDIVFFLKGLLIGLAIAAPVGPVGILCLKRTLANGRLAGLASGLGAAVADTFYGIIAAFGLTIFSDALFCCVPWLQLGGGLFLLFLGINTFFKKKNTLKEDTNIHNLLGYFSSTFFLTLTNPLTLLAFIAIFTALGLASFQEGGLSGVILLIGVFLGSMTWWLIIGEGAAMFRHKITDQILITINHIAGVMLILFGLAVLINWSVGG